MSYKESIHEAAVNILRKITSAEDGEKLLRFSSMQGVLECEYNALVSTRELAPIEQLPQEQKKSLLEQARKISSSGDTKELVRICRCLHLYNAVIQ